MFKKNKDIKVMALFALGLSVIGVVFACVTMKVALATKTPEMVWDLKFSDLVVEKKGNASSSQPNVNVTSIDNIKVKLMREGDSVIYRFKIKNKGSVDAKLKVMSKMNPTCSVINKILTIDACRNVSYTLTYNDGTTLTNADVIKAGTSKEIIMKIEYLGKEFTEVEITDLDLMLLFEQV